MQQFQSAGGVVVSSTGMVLLTNQRGDSWSLPKGHVDPGEGVQTAAEREIAEETGVTELKFIKGLGSYERYRIGKGGKGEDASAPKLITIFLYTTTQQELHPTDPLHPEAKWVPLDKVVELLTHPKDQAFFEQVKEDIRDVIA